MFDSIFIYGPTASGKTDLSLQLATLLGAEIINVDASQLYAGLPILSAHPTQEELAHTPHHLLGVWGSHVQSNMARWYNEAIDVGRSIFGRRHVPIFVGGTGLYFKALLEGIVPMPGISEEAHVQTKAMMEGSTQKEIMDFLLDKDPTLRQKKGWSDPQRLYRALSIYYETGKPLSYFHHQPTVQLYVFNPLIVTFELPRGMILERIEHRCERMMTGGAIAEVAALRNNPKRQEGGVYKTIGFPEIEAYLDGSTSYLGMVEAIVIKTRQYAKRQATWARHQMQPHLRIKEYNATCKDEIARLIQRLFMSR